MWKFIHWTSTSTRRTPVLPPLLLSLLCLLLCNTTAPTAVYPDHIHGVVNSYTALLTSHLLRISTFHFRNPQAPIHHLSRISRFNLWHLSCCKDVLLVGLALHRAAQLFRRAQQAGKQGFGRGGGLGLGRGKGVHGLGWGIPDI